MTALSIQPAYPIFTDTAGQPLDNGYIWIGTVNLAPQTNPISIYWDAALTQTAAQPLRTSGGYIVNSGTPAVIYADSDYSILVQNAKGSAVYSASESTARYGFVINAGDVSYFSTETYPVDTVGSELQEINSSAGAAQVGYDYLNSSAANTVAAELRQAQAQAQHFWAKSRANQANVYMFVTGDSTGNETTEWVYLTAQWLATELTTHTIKYRLYDDTTGWAAYTTISTGSGAQTVFIDNASVSGTNTFYTDGGRQSLIWTGINYDLVIINYGHNIGTNATEVEALPEWVIAASHCRLMAPLAGLFITLQNPRTSLAGANQSARLTSAWRKTADLVGAGVIDVYTAFETYPNPAALYTDETHPSALGSQVWCEEVQRVMAEPPRYTNFGPQGVNPLSQTPTNYIYNPRFITWDTGSNPSGWTFTNCVPTKNVSVTDGSLYSAQITISAGANPVITTDASLALPHLVGKTVTAIARVWTQTGLGLLGGRLDITSTDNVTSSSSFTSYPRGAVCDGGWQWVISTLTIPLTHTKLTVTVYAGAADGSDVGEIFYLDSVGLFEGVLPGFLSMDTVSEKFVNDFYNDDNVGLITGNTGTVTAVAGVITLTGSPVNNSDVYINLPGLTPGAEYKVTFFATGATGNTAGGLYIRNGYNGGSTTITTGTWVLSATSSTTFTAPNGPVSVWVYGYAGTTGYVLDTWAIKPVASGISPASNLALTSARNADGSVATASSSATTFGISNTPGTSTFLLAANALSATITSTVIWEYQPGNGYFSGRDLSVTANAYYSGAGTAGTKTLTLTAYRINDSTGAHGSNLGSAAITLTNAATDNVFTVTGATLAATDRIELRLVSVLQETAGTAINARINSVRVS